MMSLEPEVLFLSFVLGLIGLALFLYGKRASRVPYLVAGALFMVYPYFTPGVSSMLGVGIAIGVALWWLVRMGW